MILQILLTIILSIQTAQSIPVSFGCYLETNSVDVPIAPGLPASVNLPFLRNTSRTSYSYAISFKQLQIQKQSSGRYSILLNVSKTEPSFMQISAKTQVSPNQIKKLQILYLVVDSSFPYIQISHYTYINPSGTPYNQDISITQNHNLDFQMNRSDLILPVFSSLDLTQNNNTNLAIYVDYSYISPNQISLIFNNNLHFFCLAFTISLDIVIYHKQLFQQKYKTHFDTGKIQSDNSWNRNDPFYSQTNLDSTVFFYGIIYDKIKYTDVKHISFFFNNNQISLNYNQDVSIVYIYFKTDMTCKTNSFWDSNVCDCIKCSTIYHSQCDTCSNTTCLNCTQFYQITPSDSCAAICGDGMVIIDEEECDDNNTVNGDGCSSSCSVQDDFTCSNQTNASSECTLNKLSVSTICTVKSEEENQFTLILQLQPNSMSIYSTFNWNDAFLEQQSRIQSLKTEYDPSNGRLRILFSYNADLQDQGLEIVVNFNKLSPLLSNTSTVTLSLPINTQNNQALYYFSVSTYSLSSILQILSYVVSILTLLLLVTGYFGAKLVALQTAAVVQISILLLFSLKNMSPAFSSLKNLSLSLGITILSKQNHFYEYSNLPPHLKTIIYDRSSVTSLNFALLLIVVPLITAAVLKVLSVTKYQHSNLVDRAWKNCLGTFTFYGFMFLAYGQFCSFAVNLRYFSPQAAEGIGITVGVLFIIVIIIQLHLSNKYPKHYGSFKNKFFKFYNSQYFYAFSAAQRFVTSFLLICIQTNFISIVLVGAIFSIEALTILIYHPYMYKWWVRPGCTKLIAVVICLIYVGASLLPSNHFLNPYLVILILVMLMVLLIYSFVRAAVDIRQFWKQIIQKSQNVNQQMEKTMTVNESLNLIFKELQKKIMPEENILQISSWKPVQNQKVDIDKWRWEQYAKLYSLQYYRSLKKHIKSLDQEETEEQEGNIEKEKKKDKQEDKQGKVEPKVQNEKKKIYTGKFALYDQI